MVKHWENCEQVSFHQSILVTLTQINMETFLQLKRFFFTNYFTFWLIILLSNIIQHLYFNWINNTSIISALFIGYPIARTSPAALRNLADSSAGISNIPTSFRKNIVFYSITRCWDLEHRRRKKTKVKRASHHLWRGICRFCCFLHSGSITMFLINSKYKKSFFYRFNIKLPSVHSPIVVFPSILTEKRDIHFVKLFHSLILLPVHGIVWKGKQNYS